MMISVHLPTVGTHAWAVVSIPTHPHIYTRKHSQAAIIWWVEDLDTRRLHVLAEAGA